MCVCVCEYLIYRHLSWIWTGKSLLERFRVCECVCVCVCIACTNIHYLPPSLPPSPQIGDEASILPSKLFQYLEHTLVCITLPYHVNSLPITIDHTH